MKKVFKKVKKYLKKDRRVFAKGICLKKLVVIFIVGSIIGCYYEQILNMFKHFFADGSFFWERRRGVIYTPLSPVYGVGALLMTYFLARKKHTKLEIFIYSAVIGGVFEYLVSYIQERLVGTISWDYSTYFLNVHGRTTIPIMLGWGLAGLILIKGIYPFVSKLIEKTPYRLGNIVYYILVVVVVLDMTVSWSALLRQNLRRNGFRPFTVVGEHYDIKYSDEKLGKCFPNMRVK